MTEPSSLSNNEIFRMQCSVSFRGNWSLSVTWTRHNACNPVSDEGVPVNHGYETVVNSTSISSALNSEASSTAGTCIFYSFKILFDLSNHGFKANATNIPNLNISWNSSFIITTKELTSSAEKHRVFTSTESSFQTPNGRNLIII